MAFHGSDAGLFRGGRARGRRDPGSAGSARRSNALGLIGLDVAADTPRLDPRKVLPVLIAALAVALCVAALRTELLRVRYALAEATVEEQRLLDEERALKAERRKLRDPVHLARRAEALGFVRPEHLIDLPAAPGAGDAGALADAGRPGPP